MSDPREQAIEQAHQAAVAEAWKLVTMRNGEWTLDGEKEKRVIATRGMFEEFLLFYSGARARLDGAKMMPREATEAAVLAGLVALVEEIKRSTPRESVKDGQALSDSEAAQRYMSIGAEIRSGREIVACYRAMHDATSKDGER